VELWPNKYSACWRSGGSVGREYSDGAEEVRARSGKARSNYQVSGNDHRDLSQNSLRRLGEFQARCDMPDEANSVIQLMIEDLEAE
jgi:hypothetical protein